MIDSFVESLVASSSLLLSANLLQLSKVSRNADPSYHDISWYDGSAFFNTFDYVIDEYSEPTNQNSNGGDINDSTHESIKSDFGVGERQS